jgi:undecaprenyl-diphosphatase
MSDLVKAAILGVVQGLTEFLPVSSTGHLVIVEEALGVSEDTFGLTFDASIHLGTLAAVLIYFRATFVVLVAGWLESVGARRWDVSPDSRLAWLLLLGTIPAGIAGLIFEDAIDDAFREPALVGAMLIVFCIPLVYVERIGGRHRDLKSVGVIDALAVGLAQCVALIPGVSRSGMTIAAGMARRFRREEAAAFAFLLSAPIVAAAGGKQLFDIARGEGGDTDIGVVAVGLVTAGLTGYAAIAFLLRFLRTNTLIPFVVYRIILGVLVLALVAAGVLD